MVRTLLLAALLALGLQASGLRTLDPSLQRLAEYTDKMDNYNDRMMAAIAFLTSNSTLKAAWNKHLAEVRERDAKAVHGLPDFPCEELKSSQDPTSVHALMPGDIKVVGAIGDSLSAGSGVDALTPLGILIPWRGRTFSAGGDASLEKYITLPNVLKKYNPSLYGYATGVGSWLFPNAHFNQAVPGAISSDMPKQAKRLVDRMKSSKKIDFDNDWKVITLFIGGNDLCGSCKPKNNGKREPEMYVNNIKEALDHIHATVPKAFVNVMLMLHVDLLEAMNPGIVCQVMHLLECRCGAYPESDEARQELKERTQAYIDQLDDLVTSGRYDTREDFTVVAQPFFTETELPRKPDGSPDMSYFAADCFHLSQAGQEAAGLSLWNNMIEPVPKKRRDWHVGEELECPTQADPYFATYQNDGSQRKHPQNVGKLNVGSEEADGPNMGTEHLGEQAPRNDEPSGGKPQGAGGSQALAVTLGCVGAVLLVLALAALIVRRRRRARSEYERLLLQ